MSKPKAGGAVMDLLRVVLQIVARSYGKVTFLMIILAGYAIYANTSVSAGPQTGLAEFAGDRSMGYGGRSSSLLPAGGGRKGGPSEKKKPKGSKGKGSRGSAGGLGALTHHTHALREDDDLGSPLHFGEEHGQAGALVDVAEALDHVHIMPAMIELYSLQFYFACAVGGILSCGLTHLIVTPLDVAKCNMQTNAEKYPDVRTAFRLIYLEAGVMGLFRGWGPTGFGYALQGAFKFGLYELFKKVFGDAVGPALFATLKDLVYLAASACAEFFADFFLCPFEAVKVKVQTATDFASGLLDGLPRLVAQEGVRGLFKGLSALWMRQIPYTMMKFASFERVVELLYAHAAPRPKSECTKMEQLVVSFVAGYIAGVLCAVVSQPADNLVSKLNAQKGATVKDIVHQVGWTNLFLRGLGVRILMVGTLTGLQWGIYDAFKVYAGLPTTGASPELPFPMAPPSPPASMY